MRGILLLSILTIIGTSPSVSQTDSTQEENAGYLLTVRSGSLVGDKDLEAPWAIIAGFEGRFSANWSVPIELLIFRINNDQSIIHEISAALKLRVPLFRRLMNLYA